MRTAVLLILSCISTFAQNTKWSATLKLEVTAKDDDSRDAITSYISRELRRLGDIVIGETGTQFRLHIVAIHIDVGSTSQRLGYAISSVLMLEPPSGQNMVLGHRLALATTPIANALEYTCKELVAGYDANVFESFRKE